MLTQERLGIFSTVFPGYHGLDLFPTFYNLNLDLSVFDTTYNFPIVPSFGVFAQGHQS